MTDMEVVLDPRQSWFKDSKKARKVLHESLNAITKRYYLMLTAWMGYKFNYSKLL